MVMTILCTPKLKDISGSRCGLGNNQTHSLIFHNLNKRIVHYEYNPSGYLKMPSNILQLGYDIIQVDFFLINF